MIPSIQLNNRISQANLSMSFEREALLKLFRVLQERADSAAELEVNNFRQNDQTDEDFKKNKGLLREGYRLRPTIIGDNGQELFGDHEEIFKSPNFPESVRTVYVNSATPLKATHNFAVRNSFEMFLDFARPAIFDFSLMPSSPTPNGSNFQVQGADATWVNGVFHEIQKFISEYSAPAPWLHRHSVYDILLWVVGQPAAFWICFKASPFLPKAEGVGTFFRAALFFYLFIFILVGFRTIFHYARWVFPLMEFKHPKSKSLRHRIQLGTLCASLIGALAYDIIKWLTLAAHN